MPVPTPSVTPKAVFLSYAREDAEPARRIADALRAFGVEVWFDQNELRGGDAWDTKIKTQIRECALFVPIISGRTQNRAEGYFRREWRLGVERTHDMAHGHAFIIPVVVDETHENEALVPEEFMGVQWTRLVNGVPTPEFVAQIKRLLDEPRTTGAARRTPAPSVPALTPVAVAGAGVGAVGLAKEGDRGGDGRRDRIPAGYGLPAVGQAKAGDPALRTPKARVPVWAWSAVAVVVLVVIGYFVLRPAAKQSLAAASITPGGSVPLSPSLSPSLSNPPAADSKSIAVLPFENMSADKDNAYFCDGVQEDVLTSLANIGALRVVSRTSVEKYRGTTLSVRDIAREIGVAYILEGSVQRSGNRVRVTGQLIRAATDEHVWAQAYDRDLTDVFAIQSELAQSIARSLQAAISPEEKSRLDRKPTDNPAAYDLFLKARAIANREAPSPAEVDRRVALLGSAVELDPTFASAWGELADAHAFAAFSGYEGSLTRLAKAKDAIDRAVALAPDDPAVIQDLGTYYYYGYRDYARAAAQYAQLARVRPNDAAVFNSLALIQRRQGHWAESLANSRRATALEPSNPGYLRNLISTLEAGNRWDELIAAQQRLADLQPDNLQEQFNLATAYFEVRDSRRETEAFLARLTPAQRESPLGISLRLQWALAVGDLDEAIRLDRQQPYFDADGVPHYQQALFIGFVLAAHGDHAAAVARIGPFLTDLRARLETEPDNANYWIFLGSMEALLGQTEAANRDVARGCAIRPIASDALDGATYAWVAANARCWVGDKEAALAALPQLLRMPNGPKIYALRHAAFWAPLRDDPRFQALLADSRNNAPLF